MVSYVREILLLHGSKRGSKEVLYSAMLMRLTGIYRFALHYYFYSFMPRVPNSPTGEVLRSGPVSIPLLHKRTSRPNTTSNRGCDCIHLSLIRIEVCQIAKEECTHARCPNEMGN